jgi:PIN domain nuclease of toxin-antitoxin system
MTRLLLDTHVFMWWIDQPSRVRPEWIERIVDPDNNVCVSAVSALEIETKKRGGKLRFDHVVSDVAAELEFEQLAMTMEHAVVAGAMEWDHRDPFDRVIVAQAITDDMLLLTADEAMRSAPGVRVL